MHKLMSRVTTVICAVALIGQAQAECNPAVAPSLMDDRFSEDTAGNLTDKDTGLTWQRCSLGQSWDGANDTCVGEATIHSWTLALQLSGQVSSGGNTDWRLPNRKELASLVEFQCYGPATNISLFPGTFSGRYWTATPFPGSAPLSSWFVDFSDGSYGNSVSTDQYAVRLVRGGE